MQDIILFAYQLLIALFIEEYPTYTTPMLPNAALANIRDCLEAKHKSIGENFSY